VSARDLTAFHGLKGVYGEYLAALRGAYPLPKVPEPTRN